MRIGDYTFTEDEEVDLVFVDYHAPCGDTIRGIAIILEPKSINPVLRLLDENTGDYTASIGMNGLSTMLEYIKLRNKELD